MRGRWCREGEREERQRQSKTRRTWEIKRAWWRSEREQEWEQTHARGGERICWTERERERKRKSEKKRARKRKRLWVVDFISDYQFSSAILLHPLSNPLSVRAHRIIRGDTRQCCTTAVSNKRMGVMSMACIGSALSFVGKCTTRKEIAWFRPNQEFLIKNLLVVAAWLKKEILDRQQWQRPDRAS